MKLLLTSLSLLALTACSAPKDNTAAVVCVNVQSRDMASGVYHSIDNRVDINYPNGQNLVVQGLNSENWRCVINNGHVRTPDDSQVHQA